MKRKALDEKELEKFRINLRKETREFEKNIHAKCIRCVFDE